MGKQMKPISESYFYILLCLAKEPSHGYGIMQMTERISKGAVKIGSGTMYGATGNMIKKGWIEEVFAGGASADRKRMYRITDAGRKVLDNEIVRLRYLIAVAEELLD